MLAFLAQIATGIVDEAAALQTWKPDNFERRAGVHLLGTCRMGDEPNTPVLDKFHRTHDVPNLFLCDGSSLVTGGRGQPTCTIQAPAFRAALRLRHRGGVGWWRSTRSWRDVGGRFTVKLGPEASPTT